MTDKNMPLPLQGGTTLRYLEAATRQAKQDAADITTLTKTINTLTAKVKAVEVELKALAILEEENKKLKRQLAEQAEKSKGMYTILEHFKYKIDMELSAKKQKLENTD